LAAPAKVVDILEALKASLAAVKKPAATAAAPAQAAAAPAAEATGTTGPVAVPKPRKRAAK
jgi:hypothetical protein